MKEVIGAVSGWMTCDTNTTFCTSFPAFTLCKRLTIARPLQLNVVGYIVYGRDHGRTAIVCPWEVNHFRRSWADDERCTAIMVGQTMLLSVFMPHSGRDEEDYIEALETVRATLTEGRKAGAIDFIINGDINIESRLGNEGEDLHGFDSIEWYGMDGPEYKGCGEGRHLSREEHPMVAIERVQLHSNQHLDESR